ncbi:MAG TPA: VC0807 family protein [Acidimicrobiales bacterium]|nr:VC0807 family protein [Acidimicrobiales bacterium]
MSAGPEPTTTTEAPAWEPGAPSPRAMLPSLIGGAIIPLAVFYSVRGQVHSDATALMIAGIPASGWVLVQWLRQRRMDPIGMIVLFGFVVGVAVSLAMGGNALVLKVRDSAFTALFGVTCLVSLSWRRPVMFLVGRALSAGSDADKLRAYEELYEMPTAPRTFAIITICWGVGLIVEAGLRVLLAVTLPTGPFLAASPVLAAVVFGGLFVFTLWFSKRARRIGEELFQDQGIVFPSVPLELDGS